MSRSRARTLAIATSRIACGLNGGMAPRPFLPIETDRLVVRRLECRDVTALTTYRNLPSVARYQDWELPYTRDLAHALLDSQERTNGPSAGEWVQLAVDALVAALFDHTGVHRVAATLDPDNVPSARVLERTGFRYEGCSVSAAWVRGRWADDDRYAVLADEFGAWRARPRHEPANVELVPVDADNLAAVMAVDLHQSQYRHAPRAAEALAETVVAGDRSPDVRCRAIVTEGAVVGLVTTTATLGGPAAVRWVLVDRRHQGRGIGRRAVALVADTDHRSEV